jgi:hypothetical protein
MTSSEELILNRSVPDAEPTVAPVLNLSAPLEDCIPTVPELSERKIFALFAELSVLSFITKPFAPLVVKLALPSTVNPSLTTVPVTSIPVDVVVNF